MSISNLLLLKDNKFFKRDNNCWNEIDLTRSAMDHLELIIDDSYFFYESLDMPTTNRKKQKAIIKNFLIVNYPEELVKYFNFINKDASVIIYIISEKLIKFIDEHKEIFDKATNITAPFLEILSRFDNFYYTNKNMIYYITQGQINHVEKAEDEPIDWNKIVDEFDRINQNLLLYKKNGTSTIYGLIKIPAIVLCATYLLFVSGEIIKLMSTKSYLKKYEALLTDIYKTADVADSKDPFGMLLYRAGQNKKANKTNILETIQKISKVVDNNTIIDTLNLKGTSIRFDGTTSDYSSLEAFTSGLKKVMGKSVTILNTKKEEEFVSFSLRVGS